MPETITPEQIRAKIESRRNDIVNLHLDLVGTESITLNEGPVQAVARAAMEARGLEIDQWESSAEEIAPYIVHVGEQATFENRPVVVGMRKGAGGGNSLMLQGHIDTVPAGDPNAWIHSTWGEVDGDKVYGLGSLDMKGGVTAFISAVQILNDLNITLKGDLMVNTSVGEEDGGLGALSTVLRGYKPDGIVITEPTDLKLMVAHGGSLVFRITVHGKSAHGGSRMDGVSALEKFVPIFQDLMAWEQERNDTLRHALYDHLPNKFPISVGVVRAGEWASTVPDTLVAEGRLGFLPGETIEEMMRQTEERVAAVADADPWMKDHPPTVEWFGGQFASTEISPDEPIAKAVRSAHATINGEEPEIIGFTAGTDMRLFTEIGNIPTVVYGAGHVRLAHQPEEHLEIPDLLTATAVLVQLIIDWCGIAEA
jgi:acetylornithine deacetylase